MLTVIHVPDTATFLVPPERMADILPHTADDRAAKPDRRTTSHQRILDAAGRLFRAHGIDGVGVDAVMKEAGLTHGGFYAHFASKEALAAEVAQSLLQQAAERWDMITRT